MLHFTKMDGAGNDFVMIDNRSGNVQLRPEQIVRICDRHRGVGADGILLLERAKDGVDFQMRYYNRDGGEAEMCGNGARCFARFAHKIADTPEILSFQTPAGVIAANLHGELVTLRMSEPKDLQLSIELLVGGKREGVHFINTGVPHAVVSVRDVGDVDVRGRGEEIRHHRMFSPKGANVNFMEKCGAGKIAIRTFERGVEEETLACGTGVVASALIFAAIEKASGPINVIVRSGSELTVDFKSDHDQFRDVTLTGPAEFIFEGAIEI